MTGDIGVRGEDRTAVLARLLDGAHLTTPQELPDVVLAAVQPLGWTIVLYLVDYEQRLLVPMTPAGWEPGEPLGIDATMAGRAYRAVTVVPGDSGQPRLWVPLLDGVERLGVLDVTFPPGTDVEEAGLREQIRWISSQVGHLVSGKISYGDALARVRRLRPRTVAAELIWQLLPPLTFACQGLVVAGVLEPAYEVAGDAFDYSIDGQTANIMIMDAAGHTMRSGLLSAAVLAAARNARREGRGLLVAGQQVNDTLADHFGPESFATGILGELDVTSGRFRYLNAGHPEPLVLRRGKVVRSLSGGRCLPFGLDATSMSVGEEWLEPDDWLVFYTDGVTEARDQAGAFFGVRRLVDLVERSAADGQPAAETLRRVTHAVMDHQHGVLQDDATMLVVQWRTGREHRLTAD